MVVGMLAHGRQRTLHFRHRAEEGSSGSSGPSADDRRRLGVAACGVQLVVEDVDAHEQPRDIDLGESAPPDGRYVLRVVADPRNLLFESKDGEDPARESPQANEGVTVLEIRGTSVEIKPN